MKRYSYRIFTLSAIICSMFVFGACSDSPTDTTPEAETVAGIIVDEQAYVVPNATVEAINSSNSVLASDVTDEEGSFTLEALPGVLTDVTLRISHSDFQAYAKDLESLVNEAGNRTQIALAMTHRDSACGQLSLLVRTDEGLNAMENVEVRLTRNGHLVTKAFTGSDGRVSFDYLIAGKYALRFAKDGYKVVERGFTIEHCDSASFDIRMLEKEGGSEDSCCHGVLYLNVNENGQGIENALVKLWRNGSIVEDGRTNGDGDIVMDGICEGEYGVSIHHENYKAKEFQIVFGCNDQKTESVTLVPREGEKDSCCHGILRLQLFDGKTNAAITNATVKLIRERDVIETGKTSPNGNLIMDGICPGEYQITLIREHYKTVEFMVTFACNEDKSVTKTMEPVEPDSCCGGILELVVKDDNTGDPLKGATVKLWKDGAIVETGKTDEHGVIRMDNICEGTYGFDVIREGYKSKEFQIAFGCNEIKGETVELTNDNLPCHTASLKLRIIDDSTSTWIEGATVEVILNGNVVKTGTTDAEGWFLAEGLTAPAGYLVKITKSGYETKVEDFRFNECKRIQETIKIVSN